MEAYLDWQSKSGGIKLNDVIEDFKYVYKGQEVKAGDLVNYINGVSGVTTRQSQDVQLSTENYSAVANKTISAVQLDNSRVFIAHRYTMSGYLYAMVVTIDGAEIIPGTDTALKSSKGDGYAISACLLPNGNVFVAHSNTISQDLYGIVCAIEGTKITKGSNTYLASSSGTGEIISTCALPNGNVLVAHSKASSSSGYLYRVVCSVYDTTIQAGEDVATSASYISSISTCLLPNGNVFIAHTSTSDTKLYGLVVSVDGLKSSGGSDTELISTSKSGESISVCTLTNGNVFIAHSYGSSYQLYGVVASIDGKTITVGSDIKLNATSNTGYSISTCLLPNGKVLVLHGDKSDYTSLLHEVICTVDGTNITYGQDIQLNDVGGTGRGISSLLLTNGNVFVAHSNSYGAESSYYLYAQIFGIDYENNILTANNIVVPEYEQQVTPAIEPPFNAVALSSGVGAPEFVEGEVKKTGNIFPTSWTQETAGVFTKYYSEDGYVLESSSTYDYTSKPPNAFDGNTTGAWWKGGNATTSSWLMVTLPEAKKITKMKLSGNSNTAGLNSMSIQGKKEDGNWTDLYTPEYGVYDMEELEMNNPDFYLYYRIYIDGQYEIYEWQTSEYIAIEQIPSTEHNEQVKIARVYKEVEKSVEGNIFPITWITKDTTFAEAEDGTTLTATSTKDDDYKVFKAMNGTSSSSWIAGAQTATLTVKLPKAQKVTKMKLEAGGSNSQDLSSIKIQGSKNETDWFDLFLITNTKYPSLTEIELSNVDYYSSYAMTIVGADSAVKPYVDEWQTSEYIVKEVIQ